MKFTESHLEQSVISLLEQQGIPPVPVINFVKVRNFDKVLGDEGLVFKIVNF